MFKRNAFRVGLIFDFVNNASDKMGEVIQDFRRLREEADQTAKHQPRNRLGTPRSLSGLWKAELDETRSIQDKYNRRMMNFNRNVRHHINTYNSIIMGGVAVSMSGYGMLRYGSQILSTLNGWTEQGNKFLKTMREIKYLGQLTNQEFNKIEDKVIDIGVNMPVSNQDVATGALSALKTGYGANEAVKLAKPISQLQVLSEGALDARDSMEMLNAIIMQTGYTAEDSNVIVDKLVTTMENTAYSVDEIWRSIKSSRDAFSQLNGDLDSFLTMLGVARTALNPRFAGRSVKTWANAINKAIGQVFSNRKSEKANLTKMLFNGVDITELAQKPLEFLDYVSQKSRSLWKNEEKRQSRLAKIFNSTATTLFSQYENYVTKSAKSGRKSARQIRESIKSSAGAANKYMEELMDTLWGAKKVVFGTAETLRNEFINVMKPAILEVYKGLQKVMSTLIEFTRNHPAIVRAFGVGSGLAGVLLTVSGAAAMVLGQLMSIYGSILNVITQTATMGMTFEEAQVALAPGKNLNVGNLFMARIIQPMKTAGAQMAKLGVASAALYTAWRFDFLKLRTVVTDTMDNIGSAIQNAKKDVNELNSVRLHKTIDNLLASSNRWDKIQGRIEQFMVVFGALGEAFNNWQGTGKWAISLETMADLLGKSTEEVEKMWRISGRNRNNNLAFTLAKIIDYLNAGVDLWQGFIKGSKDAYPALKFVLKPLELMLDLVYNITTAIGKLFGMFSDEGRSALKGWEKLGHKLGVVAGTLASLRIGLAGLSLGRKALTPLKWLGGKLFGDGGGGGTPPSSGTNSKYIGKIGGAIGDSLRGIGNHFSRAIGKGDIFTPKKVQTLKELGEGTVRAQNLGDLKYAEDYVRLSSHFKDSIGRGWNLKNIELPGGLKGEASGFGKKLYTTAGEYAGRVGRNHYLTEMAARFDDFALKITRPLRNALNTLKLSLGGRLDNIIRSLSSSAVGDIGSSIVSAVSKAFKKAGGALDDIPILGKMFKGSKSMLGSTAKKLFKEIGIFDAIFMAFKTINADDHVKGFLTGLADVLVGGAVAGSVIGSVGGLPGIILGGIAGAIAGVAADFVVGVIYEKALKPVGVKIINLFKTVADKIAGYFEWLPFMGEDKKGSKQQKFMDKYSNNSSINGSPRFQRTMPTPQQKSETKVEVQEGAIQVNGANGNEEKVANEVMNKFKDEVHKETKKSAQESNMRNYQPARGGRRGMF